MAWDLAFNIQWTQRIEKEERAFLAGMDEKDEGGSISAVATPDSKRHRRRGTGGSRGSATLSQAGDRLARTPSSPSLAGSNSGRLRSSGSRASTGASRGGPSEVYIPDHLRAVAKFPVVDKDLMTARVEPTNDGKVAKVRFHPTEVKAMWWPGRQSYTRFTPEFSFEEPPEWSPEDILRQRRSNRGASRRSRSST